MQLRFQGGGERGFAGIAGQLEGIGGCRNGLVDAAGLGERRSQSCEHDMRLGQAGLELGDFFILTQRVVEPALRQQNAAEIETGFDERRFQFHRPLEMREGVIGSALAQENAAEVVVGQGIGRVLLD